MTTPFDSRRDSQPGEQQPRVTKPGAVEQRPKQDSVEQRQKQGSAEQRQTAEPGPQQTAEPGAHEQVQQTLDEALADSFPASDPVSIVTSQHEDAWDGDRRKTGPEQDSKPDEGAP